VTEVLSDDRPARLPRPVRRSLAVGALGLALALACGELAVRAHETSTLRGCVRAAESDLVDVARRAAAVEAYAGPALRGASTPPRVRRSLASLVEQSIGAGLPDLERDQQLCRSTWALHPAARQARRDYLAWFDQRLRQLTAAAADLDALHTDVPGLDAARDEAVRSLAAVRVSP
jgi:hypothetical protein